MRHWAEVAHAFHPIRARSDPQQTEQATQWIGGRGGGVRLVNLVESVCYPEGVDNIIHIVWSSRRRPPTAAVPDPPVTLESSTQILPTSWNPNDLTSIPAQ